MLQWQNNLSFLSIISQPLSLSVNPNELTRSKVRETVKLKRFPSIQTHIRLMGLQATCHTFMSRTAAWERGFDDLIRERASREGFAYPPGAPGTRSCPTNARAQRHLSLAGPVFERKKSQCWNNKRFQRVPEELGHLGNVLPAPLSQPEAALLLPLGQAWLLCPHSPPRDLSAPSYAPVVMWVTSLHISIQCVWGCFGGSWNLSSPSEKCAQFGAGVSGCSRPFSVHHRLVSKQACWGFIFFLFWCSSNHLLWGIFIF